MAAVLSLLAQGCTGTIAQPGSSGGSGDPATDGVGGGSGDPGTDPGTGGEGSFVPAPPRMTRLTTDQYANSIEDIFGPEAVPASALPSDRSTERFLSIGAGLTATSNRGVELYREAALEVAEVVMSQKDRYDTLAGCAPSSRTDPCIEEALGYFGRLLFRRSLTPEELTRYAAIVGGAGETPEALSLGLTYALAGLLQSPHFLYVPLAGEPSEEDGVYRYTSVEMASRLSYFLWSSTPDEELIDVAESGALVEDEALRAQVERMLAAPRGRDLVVRFFAEAWSVRGLEETSKDPELYPEWTPAVRDAALAEFERALVSMMEEDRSVLDTLLTSRRGYANDVLAPLYGTAVSSPELTPIELGESRSGLLTSVAVMAANALAHRTSPTLRGLFLRADVLCLSVPEPPEDIETELEMAEEGSPEEQSVRERLERHRTDPACASCHQLFDPMGMTLENFDAIGRFRTMDNGFAVDPSAEFEGTPLENASDLGQFLRDDERVSECLSKQLYAFATSHRPDSQERPLVDALARSFRDRGELFRALVADLVMSDGFRHSSPEEAP